MFEDVDEETKKFFKKVGIKRGDKYSDINDKIINYILRMGKRLDVDGVYLLDKQLSDADFMIRLFVANQNLIYVFSNLKNELKKNVDFALKYIDIISKKDKITKFDKELIRYNFNELINNGKINDSIENE